LCDPVTHRFALEDEKVKGSIFNFAKAKKIELLDSLPIREKPSRDWNFFFSLFQ